MASLTTRRFAVSDEEWSERYFVSPRSGDLLVASRHDLASAQARAAFRRLGVDMDAPEWRDDGTFAPVAHAHDGADPVLAGRYSSWQRRERRALGFLRAWLGPEGLARRAAKSRAAATPAERHAVLRVLADAGPGPVDECLVTSFTQTAFLVSQGIGCTLSIGCWTPTINMHAWVSVGEAGRQRLVSEPFDRVCLYRPSVQFEFHAPEA